ALWPVIADLLAMKQVNGLSSTTSTKFCSHCTLSIQDYLKQDYSNAEPQTSNTHRVQAITWKTAESSAKQTNLFLEHGVCYAVLSELSY
ncbi:hypothetical protein CROQUDRAFT_54784, partial [Cronartium quercuum f. sp. fusiforme G11]